MEGQARKVCEEEEDSKGNVTKPILPLIKLVGSLNNNDDKKYTTNKQQMMVVDNGWDGKGHSGK